MKATDKAARLSHELTEELQRLEHVFKREDDEAQSHVSTERLAYIQSARDYAIDARDAFNSIA